ncbi:hypothetical protein MUK42_36402 [Musa troglodytarum]|uniref:Uncharacterized protein n=1 Tax=Musa troglodytarum TaxID=320322 RepID=A0A9E7GEB3_9LILI|nr:hypothetical protein MUK42_36402 [Musa troglodytarum]
MLRQVSGRNQRGKGGFKTKNVLHVCLLVAICVWLLYQMKHSHDKKKAYEERVSKLSFKGGEKRLDLANFGRKDLRHTVETEPIREAQIQEEDDEKVEHEVRREEGGDEEEGGEGNKDRTKGVDGLQDRDHEEASHKAREMSFRGDDASSEVVHIIQEVEHEEGLREARERSFRGDDASSAVAHVPQVNEPVSESEDGGSRNLDETGSQTTETKDGEVQDEDSSALTRLDNSRGNGSEPSHNNTVFTRVVSPQSTTTGESETHKKQRQPDLIIMSVINNQTDSEGHSTNMTINFLKNSTAVSIDGVAAQASLTAKWDANDVTASQNQTTSTRSVDGRTNTVELETQEPIEKDITVAKPEDSEESYKNSSATNENVVRGNSVHGLAHGDVNLPGIQNGGHKEEAAAT